MTYGHGRNDGLCTEEVPPADWAALAARFSDYTYEQDHDYVAAGARRVGARVRLLLVRAGTRPIGAACLRVKTVPGLGRGIAYISSGPMLTPDPASGTPAEIGRRAGMVLGALADNLARREGHVLRVRLAATTGPLGGSDPAAEIFSGLGYVPTDRSRPYRTVLVDLDQDEAGLQKKMHSKWRNHLRRANDAGLEVVSGRDREFVERFLALYTEMRNFKTFDGLDPEILRDMIDTGFGFEVRIARHGGQDVAGHVTAFTPRCATYLFGATTEAGRTHRAGYRLVWDTMLAAKARQIRWYDLGGIDKSANPAGHEFKTRTGGIEVMAAGPFESGSGFRQRAIRGLEALRGALQRRPASGSRNTSFLQRETKT